MRFKVVGNHAVDGVPPGRRVVIDDPERARWLTRAGHVRPVVNVKKKEVADGDPGLD